MTGSITHCVAWGEKNHTVNHNNNHKTWNISKQLSVIVQAGYVTPGVGLCTLGQEFINKQY